MFQPLAAIPTQVVKTTWKEGIAKSPSTTEDSYA